MPVSVQLPGYNRAAPAVGLADIINTVGNIRQRSQQSDLMKSQQENEDLKNQAMQTQQRQAADAADPTSVTSENARQSGLAALGQIASRKEYQNTTSQSALKNMVSALQNGIEQKPVGQEEGPGQPRPLSAIEVDKMINEGPFSKSMAGIIEADAKAAAMMPLAEARMAGVENQKDRIAASAADHFDKDPILTKINKQKQQIDLDKHTLDASGGKIPVSLLNEVQQGLANAISGGGSAGLGKTEQIEIKNASTKITSLLQGIQPGVQYVDDPELVGFLRGTMDRLGSAYDKNAYSRAQQISTGRASGYRSNPAAIQVMQDKVKSYEPAQSAVPPHGQTVIQGGHTYNWNPQTGQYE